MVEQISPPEMVMIDKGIMVMDLASTVAFLNENPQLTGLINTARSLLPKYFPEAKYRLELVSDPEVDHQELLLAAMTTGEVDEVMERLYQFRDDWWLDHVQEAKMKLSIDVEVIS